MRVSVLAPGRQPLRLIALLDLPIDSVPGTRTLATASAPTSHRVVLMRGTGMLPDLGVPAAAGGLRGAPTLRPAPALLGATTPRGGASGSRRRAAHREGLTYGATAPVFRCSTVVCVSRG